MSAAWWERLDPQLLDYATPDELEALFHALQAEHRDHIGQHIDLGPPEDWLRQYLPNAFRLPFGPHHRKIFDLIGTQPRGIRAFVGAARGSGKTTGLFLGGPTRAIAQGSHRFIVICGVNQTEAERRLSLIRSLVRHEDSALLMDHPNLRLFRLGTRVVMDQTNEIWLEGGRIVAIGAGAPFRGLVRELPDGTIVRPDLLLLDDVETEEQARSKLRTDRLEEWIFSELSNLGGPGEEVVLDVVGIGTTIDVDAVATRALKREGRFAGWDTSRFPAEAKVGTPEDADSDELVLLDAQGEPIDVPVPDDAVDGERVATWPEGQPLHRLDKLITPGHPLFIGTLTYAKEFLLDPRATEDRPVKPGDLRHGTPPEALSRRTIGIDPAATTKTSSDYSAIVEAGIDPVSGRIWIVDAWHGKVTMKGLFDRAEQTVKTKGAMTAYEGVAGFAWGEQELMDRGMPHRGYKPDRDKLSRLLPIALLYEQQKIWHGHWLKGSELESELLSFPGAHDDLVDALVLAVTHITSYGGIAADVVDDWDPEDDPYTADRRGRLFGG